MFGNHGVVQEPGGSIIGVVTTDELSRVILPHHRNENWEKKTALGGTMGL